MATRLLLILLFATNTLLALAQSGGIRGRITDAATGESLAGVNVILSGTNRGTATGSGGEFELTGLAPGSHNIRFSFIGYQAPAQTVTVGNDIVDLGTITLQQSAVMAGEVVVSASRRPEKLTEAPATISVINSRNISELPSFNVGELIARQKGVDYIRTGVLGTGLNVRGFNSAFNPKNLQMNDARLSTLIATGLPLGPLTSVVKEDIERIEIILGPSAALYGPNAHNGLVNTISKDPRTSQGTTVALGLGNQRVFSARFRHAQVLSPKWAFKVTGEYTKGQDFKYVDTVYYTNTAFKPAKFHAAPEIDLNRNFNSLHGEAAVYYSLNEKSDVIVSYGGNQSNFLAQTNAGRNQIKDWQVHYLHARYVSPRVFAQVYHTWSNTDNTYAINQRTQNYLSFKDAGFSEEEARRRSYEEQWFGTTTTSGVALKRGAVFKDNSRRLNAEIQYNNSWQGFDVIVGSQYQRDMANSRHSYLFDSQGNIIINQIGVYAQVEKKIFGDVKAIAAARADKHDLYGFNFIPKAGLVWNKNEQSVRLTYGKGIAAPTILNLDGYLFGGLLIGNGEGYTLSDGTKIDKLQVETINSVEVGYKGKITPKFYFDANAYYNTSENFLSPAINIATQGRKVTQRGSTPLSEVVPGTPESGAATLLTYVNFGKVNTYGADLGATYYLTNAFNLVLNYSYFGYDLDKNDKRNDGNKDGKVQTQIDLPINTPSNKASFAVNYSGKKFFGSVFTRWVQEYDFFSGINVAAAANTELGIKENARYGRTWNYGPLGGFTNVDVSAGYHVNSYLTASAQVVNLFDSKVREFVASPFIGRLYSVELKVNLPAIHKQ
ncbi:TonB-dependent receptor [Hymenobacter sp. BT491]|uniref:TonB-dependent receptor n=1 Tax=Hymenobacter sp. BT491 TaxID=2766779 RepID=UPI00165344FB|nr:TonB-dependent receptor [Hymenobacter sp. BT491]MBC6989013.1 TonB-dependent receptor [Hymenobacter sp. BT491]